MEVHQRENSEDTESFLQENIDKFENGAMFLLNKMKRGERLSAKTVMMKYGIHDRRLRDLEIAGKCQKEWMVNSKGKRTHVEYFIPLPHPPTKSEVVAKAAKIINLTKSIPGDLKQGDLFEW
jgi:hypothetical protein